MVTLFSKPISLCFRVGFGLGAALLAATAAAAQSGFPAPVEKALAEAEAQDDYRVSYSMRFIWPDAEPVTARYDATTKRWATLSGDPDALSGAGPKKFKTWKRVESKPGGLLYADYRSSLRDVTLVGETDDALTYNFVSPQTPDSLEEAADVVETKLVIDKTDGRMSLYSVRALKPFKPNVASNLEEFEFTQTFARIGDDGPAVMTKTYWRAKGKRVFSSVDEEYTVEFFDFEPVTD